jgi:hypothetical protein
MHQTAQNGRAKGVCPIIGSNQACGRIAEWRQHFPKGHFYASNNMQLIEIKKIWQFLPGAGILVLLP